MLLLAKLAGRPYKSYANLHSLNLESLCPAADNLIGLDAEKKRRKDEIAKAAAIRLEMVLTSSRLLKLLTNHLALISVRRSSANNIALEN